MRKNLWIVALILAAWLPSLGSIAYSSVWQWSKTASSNASADPTVNWREGQPPSSVNDSGRAMMAALAQYSADTSGSLLTTGSATAYSVTTNSAYAGETLAAISGRQIAFTVHTTSGATVVINVDGLGNQPLRSAPAVELAAGALIQGTVYRATYNNADGAWYLQDFYSSGVNVPIGGLIVYTGPSAPNASFVLPNGQAISRTTYAAYFSLVGTTFGPGDGVTTFNVPDLRGRLIAGLDSGGSNRITAAGGNYDANAVGNAGGVQNSVLTQAQLPSVAFPIAGANITISGLPACDTSGACVNGGLNLLLTASTNRTYQIGPTGALTLTGSAGSGGSNSPHPLVPPSMALNYLLRVL